VTLDMSAAPQTSSAPQPEEGISVTTTTEETKVAKPVAPPKPRIPYIRPIEDPGPQNSNTNPPPQQ
jgi:hypothetical protein